MSSTVKVREASGVDVNKAMQVRLVILGENNERVLSKSEACVPEWNTL